MFVLRIIGSASLLRITSGVMAASSKKCRRCNEMKYLNQDEATNLDVELFNEYKFSVDQLMELAGLSVATAVAQCFPPRIHNAALIIVGPGNNGGDGLVAARHMTLFGYRVDVYYPKRTPKPLYENLLEQCSKFGVGILDCLPEDPKELRKYYQVIVDALFGFSFRPPVREQLKPALDALVDSGVPVCSVDIPSGWNVEKGPVGEKSLKPAMLISLSAPKMCARPEILKDVPHFLGGRFLPPSIICKYNLTSLPPYPGQDLIVRLCKPCP